MKNIITRRYYLSDFMCKDLGDGYVYRYDGFFVDLIPDTKHVGYTDFWLGHEDYGCKDFMFGINHKDCATDEAAQDFIIRNVCEYIEGFVNEYFNDYDDRDCDNCGCCEDDESEIDCDLLEAIEMHNDHVEKMQDLAEILMNTYPNVESTPVNDAFIYAFNGLVGNAIYLCCEANSYGGKWMTTSDWKVVDDDVDD